MRESKEVVEVPLYNGGVLLRFNPSQHKYTVVDEGVEKRVPSVTTVCSVLDKSAALTNWAANLASDHWKGAIQANTEYGEVYLEQVAEGARKAHRVKKQEAADIGSRVHERLESRFRRALVDGSDDWELVRDEASEDLRVQSCLNAASDWLASHEVKPLEIERRIYSRKHEFSGTLDKLAVVDGEVALVDWKSSKGLYPEYRLQTAAYVMAYEEETHTRVAKRYLVRLGKEDGVFEAHEFTRADLRADWKAFKAALDIWKWREGK